MKNEIMARRFAKILTLINAEIVLSSRFKVGFEKKLPVDS